MKKIDRRLRHLWRPYTQMHIEDPPLKAMADVPHGLRRLVFTYDQLLVWPRRILCRIMYSSLLPAVPDVQIYRLDASGNP